ncbi:flavin-dependent oxidoreductase [Phaeobacter sp. B1627]|uniref:flavin-dependent oxidoreductase n=1 Tax=Phaeobacter sp. B1627 TaxID=2583809 RepID=UPI001119450B|nr:flavin-dependent oxidoreductase [Phaeobacter sp. B1627]TNJ41434.1 flavin-dependent oxidoreductase [Phaeobacter sp. B1627]
MTVLIAGGGIAGLTLGLTLHQIGVPFRVFEATQTLKPMGVGINLQPNAVRELFDLGLEADLDAIGVRTRSLGFYSKLGHTIWEEPRGMAAGYAWPQFSVHRGALQMLLYETLIARAGADVIETDARATGCEEAGNRAILHLEGGRQETGTLLLAADGIHSALRAQFFPQEGPPIWDGRILWRATTRAPLVRGEGAMMMIGHDSLRFVSYPISAADEQGIATLNWIAEKRFDPDSDFQREDWNRAVEVERFIGDFSEWRFDWIDVPALIRGAGRIFEYPMVDRDPLPQWTFGRCSLMGDAAHPTYPIGSNGASQAILDARVIGARLLEHGITKAALDAYEGDMRPAATRIGFANRSGNGPDAVLQQVETLCGGDFEEIDSVIPRAELAAHAAKYKAISGFSIEELNAQPPTIAEGMRLR